MKHWIGMAGMHGCLPNYCGCYRTYEDAANGLAELHDLGRNRSRELRRDSYIELNLHRDGNEYAEISECDCDEPWVHSEEDRPEDWAEEES